MSQHRATALNRTWAFRHGTLGALAAVTLVVAGCERLIVAPSDSLLTLVAPVTAVPLNGTLEVTALLTDSTGEGLDDGSSIFFSSTLGTMTPFEVRVNDGRATTTLMAGDRAGIARIRASSGGLTSGEIEIRVGSVAERIVLASSQASPTSVTIVATVFDATGRTLPGVPVAFETSEGTLTSSVVVTDADGRAVNTLFSTTRAVVTAAANGIVARLPVSFE